MSATGRSDVRDPDDFYATPAWCTRALIPHLPIRSMHTLDLLDPCAGTGAIMSELATSESFKHEMVRGIECNAERRRACASSTGLTCDGGNALVMGWGAPTHVVMNPPFAHAMVFVETALDKVRANGTVAALLRLPWLASQSRAEFHRKHPSDVLVLPKRPEFCMSCSCGAKPKCGWSEVRAIGTARPSACGGCGGKAQVSTSDATDYAWFVWGPGRGNRWHILSTE